MKKIITIIFSLLITGSAFANSFVLTDTKQRLATDFILSEKKEEKDFSFFAYADKQEKIKALFANNSYIEQVNKNGILYTIFTLVNKIEIISINTDSVELSKESILNSNKIIENSKLYSFKTLDGKKSIVISNKNPLKKPLTKQKISNLVFNEYFKDDKVYSKIDFSLVENTKPEFNLLFSNADVYMAKLKTINSKEILKSLILVKNSKVITKNSLSGSLLSSSDDFISCIDSNFKLDNAQSINLYIKSLLWLGLDTQTQRNLYNNNLEITQRKDSIIINYKTISITTYINEDKSIKSLVVAFN